jgi:hypothetical protein
MLLDAYQARLRVQSVHALRQRVSEFLHVGAPSPAMA